MRHILPIPHRAGIAQPQRRHRRPLEAQHRQVVIEIDASLTTGLAVTAPPGVAITSRSSSARSVIPITWALVT